MLEAVLFTPASELIEQRHGMKLGATEIFPGYAMPIVASRGHDPSVVTRIATTPARLHGAPVKRNVWDVEDNWIALKGATEDQSVLPGVLSIIGSVVLVGGLLWAIRSV